MIATGKGRGGDVTKADIVERIQNSTWMTKKDAVEVAECFFDTLKATLESGETVKIARFGNFPTPCLNGLH
jgi:integration host factor subunit alpha